MKIFISNYSSYRGNKGVSISITTPEWASVYKKLSVLAPSPYWVNQWNKVKHLPDCERKRRVQLEFMQAYWNKLLLIKKDYLISLLEEGDVLLCWCAKGEFCHRYILALYLKRIGIEVEERSN